MMLKKIVAILSIVVLCFGTIDCDDEQPKIDQRKFQIDDYKDGPIIAKFNTEIILKKPKKITYEEIVNKWKLNGIDQSGVVKIYKEGNLLLNTSFSCLPKNDSCYDLKIKNFTKDLIGSYLRESTSTNLSVQQTVEYFVHGIESPINVTCELETSDRDKKCVYNATTKTLSVDEKTQVKITCFSKIYNNTDTPELGIEHRYGDSNMCNEKRINDDNEDDNDESEKTSYKVTKACGRFFKRNDTLYTCALRDVSPQTDRSFRLDLDTLDIKLNILYKPEKNQTEYNNYTRINNTLSVSQESQLILTCPFHGNPIVYEWRLKDKNKNIILANNTKSYVLKKNFPTGNHTITCFVNGIGVSDKFEFQVIVSKSNVLSTNTLLIVFIVGAICLAILLIGTGAIVFFRNRMSNMLKKPTNEQKKDNPADGIGETAPLAAADTSPAPSTN